MKHAVYPGSFDPFTNGHWDIVLRAARLFDHITIAVLKNNNKTRLFSINERVEQINEVVKKEKKISVESFEGLLVDFCKRKNIHIIVRGLRTVTDYDYEQAIAMVNRSLLTNVETIFLTADKEHSFTSSSIIKEVVALGGDISEQVPPNIYQKLKEIYRI